MNTKRAFAAALLLLAALPMYADFNAIASAIESHRGVHRVWVPGLGLARFFVWMIRPEGVHDFQLVTFEGAGRLDPRELHDILAAKIDPGFSPLAKVWSRKSQEWSFVYARPRPNSGRIELVVLTHDDENTVLVRVDVDAVRLARNLNNPRSVVHIATR